MKDIFTLKTIQLTPEIGMALKNFRIEHNVTAKSIINRFEKASSYISKLEKGDIKKVDSSFFVDLCNYITDSDEGLFLFIRKIAPTYKDYTDETKVIIMNMDDLLITHKVMPSFVTDIKNYLESHNMSVSQLTAKINANEDILKSPDYDIAPENEWFSKNSDIDRSIIKLSIPQSYIEDLLNNQVDFIHGVIAEAILYSMYRLGKEKDAATLAHSKLKIYKILRVRGENIVRVNDETLEKLFGGLEPETADALKNITSGLKLITTLTKGYGSKRIKQMSKNMKEDLGFYFAYMSLDISELEAKDKEVKQAFLNDLKELIKKHSQTDNSLDMYD